MVYRRPTGAKPVDGTIILVLGLLSLITCALLGPIAWSMGNRALDDIRSGYADPSQKGLVEAGRICGMVATFLFLAVAVGVVLMVVVFGVLASK